MCGIFGFVHRTPQTSVMMPFLALEMLRRGRDSWGVTDGINVVKKIGPIIDSWQLPSWGDSLIFHTRAGSVGDKTITNQHPFVFPEIDDEDQPTGKLIVGVHNGGISNHSELNAKYKRNFPVDSMHVFAHIAEGWPINELRGAGAFVWFETTPGVPPEMHFARSNMHDFHVFRLNEKSLVFCSLRLPVDDTAKLFGWKCEELIMLGDREYVASVDEQGVPGIVEGDAFSLSTNNYARTYVSPHNTGTSWNSGSYSAGMCPSCHYSRQFCQCDEDNDLGTDEALLDFWISLARSSENERIFAKELPESKKGLCKKCLKINTVALGHELVCPSCLLDLVKEFDKRKWSYEYKW